MVLPYWQNDKTKLFLTDSKCIPLEDKSVHTCVTSPPYYKLRTYSDDSRSIGMEQTVEDYISNLMDVFKEVKRVLRDDGIFWLNIADHVHNKNLLNISDMIINDLIQDGWFVRQRIIWHKSSVMPHSLLGTRYEPCRQKVKNYTMDYDSKYNLRTPTHGPQETTKVQWQGRSNSEYIPCPGCKKCENNNGFVLKQDAWKCTDNYEFIFMIVKGMNYYSDPYSIKTEQKQSTAERYKYAYNDTKANMYGSKVTPGSRKNSINDKVNRRSVWSDIKRTYYRGDHYAVFPAGLPELCIKAGTSEEGCCIECGKQLARIIKFENNDTWMKTCNCKTLETIPSTVLDPFSGTGTTSLAAQELGRNSIGIELNEEYIKQSIGRLN